MVASGFGYHKPRVVSKTPNVSTSQGILAVEKSKGKTSVLNRLQFTQGIENTLIRFGLNKKTAKILVPIIIAVVFFKFIGRK